MTRGYIRIRTPDDAPGHWTARGDIIPGQRYTYISGDVAVLLDWEMAGPPADDYIAGMYVPRRERPKSGAVILWIAAAVLIVCLALVGIALFVTLR